MIAYTLSEARRKLAAVLDQALNDGAVEIRRRDGSVFIVRPERPKGSPLDVGCVKMGITAGEVVAAIQEGRERGD